MAKNKPFFDKVDPKANFPSMEKELLDYWYKKGIVKKYLQKNKSSKKNFSFLDGPITANNPMGVHHAWGRTYKDLWQRFRNMQGYKQRFQNGFDCQGLWVEVEVEKELGLKSKKDIENLVKKDVKKSIAEFVELCRKRVEKYAAIQTEQSKRLGYFMDWENSYYTLSDENNYMIWYFLKKCHERKLIYKGRDSVPWCPRCGTAISQHEILTEDYKELTHDALYVAYPIKKREGEHLVIWTTTPWTLVANVAVAADPKVEYVLAKSPKTNDKYYLLEGVAKRLGLKVIRRLKGKELIGFRYQSPFDHLARVKQALDGYQHRVVASDERILPIATDEGTGLVHIATGAGSEDFALGKKEKLPVIAVIDEEAVYLEGLGQFSGKNAKDHPEIVIDYLRDKKTLLEVEKYKHRYPACWRCKTELVWRVVDEWYIAIDPVREEMKSVTKRIKWIPSFGLKRELDWLNNMHDWLISKKRYWGLALPIWECEKCGHFEVIGSRDELGEKAIQGWSKFSGKTPHRPWVDEVKIKCPKCGGVSKRIPDVGSPWLDAGIVAYSTITKNNKGTPLYLKDKRKWKKWFPADFITESFPGQFKNWFYSLIAMSTVLEKKEPTRTVLGFATLFGEDGRPMHKSWGNAIEFNEGADKIGVDVMRWVYLRQNPTDNLLFGYRVSDEARRRFHLKLWNVYNFFTTYANLDGYRPSKTPKLPRKAQAPRGRQTSKTPNVLDRWIIVRLNQLIKEVTDYLENYDAYNASRVIEKFVDDLSNWYVRRSRERVGPAAESGKDKEAFYRTLYFVLVTLAKLLAPFTPYLADTIYRNLTKEESVHLRDWPRGWKLTKTDEKTVKRMVYAREIVEKAHAERKQAGIPVRQALASLVSTSPLKLRLQEGILVRDEVNVLKHKNSVKANISAKLDLKTKTPELEEKTKSRELIRKIQKERMKLGMDLAQRVIVTNTWLPKNKELTRQIKGKTLANKLKKGTFKVERTS
jgi:isoleucyl-tRNA synthetase